MDEKEIKALVDAAAKPLTDANAAQATEIKALKDSLAAEKIEREKVTKALEAENAELKDELQVWTDKGAMFVEQGARLEAMRRKERARELFDNPPSPHAGLTEWQRWKEETDAAIAAQQEQEA